MNLREGLVEIMNVEKYFVEENNVLIVDGNKAIIKTSDDKLVEIPKALLEQYTMQRLKEKHFLNEREMFNQSNPKPFDVILNDFEEVLITYQEINQCSLEHLYKCQLYLISNLSHKQYKHSLYAITRIFLSRNQLAEIENKEKLYNQPIFYAVHEFLKGLSKNKPVKLNGYKTYHLSSDITRIITEYGEDQGINKEDLKKYINKSAEKYNIEKIFD